MTRTKNDDPRTEPRAELDKLFAFGRRALRSWRAAAVAFLIGEVACVIFLVVKKPLYRSQTVVLYTETIRSAETGEPAMAPKSVAVRIQELLNSRRELGQVVEEFDLYPDVRKTYGAFDAVDELRKHIEFRSPGGDTFSIGFQGRSPKEARDVTAKLADLVVTQDAELRKKQAIAARDFLADEKKRAADRLKDAELDLAGFLALHPKFALDAMPLATGAAVRASVARSAGVPDPRRPRVIALPAPKSDAPPPALPVAAPTPVDEKAQREAQEEVSRAAAAVEAARQGVTDKLERYTNAHPDVRSAREALTRAEARLASAKGRLPAARLPAPVPAGASSADVETKPAQRFVTLPGKPGAADQDAREDLVTLETDWARLTRAVTEARQRHDQVEASLFKADIAQSSVLGGQGTQATVIDPAYLPQRPVPPGPRTVALLFLAASLFLGVVAAVLRAILDDRVYDAAGAEGVIDVFAEIPGERRRHA